MELENPTLECMQRHFEKFGTTIEQVEEDVKIIKQWYKQQLHLPQDTDKRHHLFSRDTDVKMQLMNHKFSIERTKQAMDMHYTLKVALPEFFSGRDPLKPELQRILNLVDYGFSKRLTNEGYRLAFLRLNEKDASKLILDDNCAKLLYMIAESTIANFEEQALGAILIIDCANVGISHLAKLSMELLFLKKVDICSQKCYPTPIKGVHFMNPPSFMDSLLSVCKAFVRTKVVSRFHVHTTLESLHEHVDVQLLPLDYGGKDRKLSEISDEWKQLLINLRGWFMEQEAGCKVDESKRPGKAIDTNELFGIEGSFKKLTVD